MRSGRAVEPERVLDLLQRRGAGREVAGAPQLVLGERLLGVALDGLGQGPLVAALRDAHCTREPRSPHSHSASASTSGGQLGHEDLARHGLARVVGRLGECGLLAVELREEPLDQRAVSRWARPCRSPSRAGRGPGRRARGRPAPRPRARPGRRRPRRRRCRRRAPRPASPSPGAARRGRRAGGPPSRTPARPAAASIRRSSSRIEPVRAAGQEVAEVVDDVAVLVRGDPADARGGALVDVAEQAGAPDLAVAAEHPGAAGAGREDPQQEVERLADGPGVGVGPEVAHALAARAAVDVQPGELLARRSPRAPGRSCRRGSGR